MLTRLATKKLKRRYCLIDKCHNRANRKTAFVCKEHIFGVSKRIRVETPPSYEQITLQPQIRYVFDPREPKRIEWNLDEVVVYNSNENPFLSDSAKHHVQKYSMLFGFGGEKKMPTMESLECPNAGWFGRRLQKWLDESDSAEEFVKKVAKQYNLDAWDIDYYGEYAVDVFLLLPETCDRALYLAKEKFSVSLWRVAYLLACLCEKPWLLEKNLFNFLNIYEKNCNNGKEPAQKRVFIQQWANVWRFGLE